MKINKADVDKMIKEEFQKMMEKKKLSQRLSKINEELDKMNSEDDELNEVEAGEKTKVSSHAWTGKENGDVKWDPKFEKKGTHLKEDGMSDEEIGANTEIDMAPEMGANTDTDMAPEMGEFESKFAAIGKAIDAKLSAEAASEETGEEISVGDSDDDFEEVEVEPENGGSEAEGTESNDGEESEEIEEYKELVGGQGEEQGITADQAVKKESVEEPLEGHSVAQEASVDSVNDNMEKDSHVKEGKNKSGEVITEDKKPTNKNIFTEGVDDAKREKILKEMNKWKKFAGLSKEDEE